MKGLSYFTIMYFEKGSFWCIMAWSSEKAHRKPFEGCGREGVWGDCRWKNKGRIWGRKCKDIKHFDDFRRYIVAHRVWPFAWIRNCQECTPVLEDLYLYYNWDNRMKTISRLMGHFALVLAKWRILGDCGWEESIFNKNLPG